ncbi:MAG: AbrB/MazE/SpoVT family DNA-binding domain-containing protein [Holophagales bacterium]|nr:AbrB/MazE/SpoVT family DNA-binding domain-containing protein [Holophagales bacterium]MYF97412.1 AbrB/MazE/SpoVT family DNA-binding domain-containing protein [Holophagales bacterium]
MPRVDAKRQITLPIEVCREAGIKPGDEYGCFAAEGRITIVRKETGAAKGFLRRVTGDQRLSDDESLRSALDEPNELR